MITKSKHPIARALTRPILRRAVRVTAVATSASPQRLSPACHGPARGRLRRTSDHLWGLDARGRPLAGML